MTMDTLGDCPTPVQPATLVDYQADAIVSHPLLERARGTMTVFALDTWRGFREHTAPFDAVVQVLEGEAEIAIAGRPSALTPGEMLLIPAHQRHSIMARTPCKLVLTTIGSM